MEISPTTVTTSKPTTPILALEKWGFPLQELYRLSFTFYKQNSGKAIHLSYEDNLKLIAYKQQASLGPFDAEHAPALGVLDVIGRDRRQHWQLLGDITREQAMEGFIDLLDKMCSSFRPYVEAVKQNRDETLKAELRRMEAEKAAQEQREREQQEQLEEGYKEELQRRQLQDALNKQTYQQFKLYAEKQFPGNPEQQAVLIHQLQREHYHQYMLQLHMQNQNQQNTLQPQQQQSNATTAAALNSNATAGTAATASSLTSISNNNNNNNNINLTAKSNNPTASEISNAMENLQIAINETLTETGGAQQQQQAHDNADTAQPSIENLTYVDVDADVNGDADEDEEDYVIIRPAKIWTRPDIGEFKAEVSAGDGDGVITVGHGDTVTVRVPTNINGKCIFWEFATDNYDIGFGIYFEWAKSLTSEVTVHVSDSDDDEDCVDEDYLSTTDDLESGSLAQNRQALAVAGTQHTQHTSSSSHIKPPISIIVPIYRRECYNEVYVGSHPYPGEGVYLLKFDNSYSIWRSKTLYYRVYYER